MKIQILKQIVSFPFKFSVINEYIVIFFLVRIKNINVAVTKLTYRLQMLNTDDNGNE